MRTVALAALVLQAGAALAQDDAARLAYNNHCRTCHSLDEGDNRLGPSLHGVVGRAAGTLGGYAFSRSMARSGVTWDAEALDRFIEAPDTVVRGHRMRPYPGIADPAVRQRVLEALGAR